MRIAGGVIALVAGILGFGAAIFTLFMGGLGSALDADGGTTVVALGYGGILFSFLVIILAGIALGVRSRIVGALLMISSVLGAVLGGTFVAVLMVLSLIGGLLVTIGGGKKKSSSDDEDTDTSSPKASGSGVLAKVALYGGIAIGTVILLLVGVSMISGLDDTQQVAGANGDGSSDAEEYFFPNESIAIDRFNFSLIDLRSTDVVGESFLRREAAAGETFVAVAYQYENISDAPINTLRAPRVSLIDANGYEYSADIGASSAYSSEIDLNTNAFSDINPGITRSAGDVFVVSSARFDAETWLLRVRVGRVVAHYRLVDGPAQSSVPSAPGGRSGQVTPIAPATAASSDTATEADAERGIYGNERPIMRVGTYGHMLMDRYGLSPEQSTSCCASVIGVSSDDTLNVRIAPFAEASVLTSLPFDKEGLQIFGCTGREDAARLFAANEAGERVSRTWCLIGEDVGVDAHEWLGWVNAHYLFAISPSSNAAIPRELQPSPRSEGVRRHFSPSYDCQLATTEIELLICGSPELSESDHWLGQAYRNAMARVGEEQAAALRAFQRQWIRRRNETCNSPNGTNVGVSCLRDMTREQIFELANFDGLNAEPHSTATSSN